MTSFKKAYGFLKRKYNLLTLHKYTTLAGTLVFFLIMSIVPLTFWLTILIGRLPINLDRFLSLEVFESVKDILNYVREEALNATTSVSVVLLITTLYSSTTLFYQIRRSGEIIYDYRRQKAGLRLRVGALLLMLLVMALFVVFVLLVGLGSVLFSKIVNENFKKIADYVVLLGLSFALALLLNVYICPYKTAYRRFLPGTIITVVAWTLAVIGFSLYMKFGGINRLYGALSTVIVFFLWLYVLTICFIMGVIFNSESIVKEQKAERKRKRKVDKA